jgi:uncharacterized protein (TIRG00374 family)
MVSKRSIKTINWKLWAGLILSALFLYLAFRQVDLKKTGKIILSSDLRFLLPAFLIIIAQYLIRAWRWDILLRSIKHTGFNNRFLSVLIGFAANCVLPARLGEFIRANSLGQAEKISKSASFGTLVIERLFDGFVILFILIIGLFFTEFPADMTQIGINLRRSAVLFSCAFIILIVFIAGFRYRTDLFTRVIYKLFFMFSDKMRSKIVLIVENFALGLAPVRGFYSWCIVIIWSILLWSLSLLQIQLIGASIGVKLPFITSFIIMGMLSMGVMVPSAPGFIGTFHLSVQYGFMLFGVSPEEGLSAAILLHASFFVPTIFLGLIAFTRMQVLYGKIEVGKEVKEGL